jgi:hypothetical protein
MERRLSAHTSSGVWADKQLGDTGKWLADTGKWFADAVEIFEGLPAIGFQESGTIAIQSPATGRHPHKGTPFPATSKSWMQKAMEKGPGDEAKTQRQGAEMGKISAGQTQKTASRHGGPFVSPQPIP